jgi:crotonobetainyl-CoA:carnitine CoA-transferase CaiB-like acyl-CoA transferase
MVDGILNGIRVLDFTWVLAGPYATRLLADFGAEVIKVQSAKTARGAEANATGYFSAWNRNKRSITLDMGRPEARSLALKLAAISDVVVESFSPRVKANWGFDFDRLREANPRLVMASLSGMGQTGPWRDRVAFGPTVQALSGLTALSSFEPETPIGLGYAHADPIAGLYAALAILAVLEQRDKTGRGLTIDLSAYEAACSLVGPALLAAQFDPGAVRPQGNRSRDLPAAPYGCYRCAGQDRWCVIAAFDTLQWQTLCAQMGFPAWAQDERFATAELRKTHQDELDERLGEWTALHTPEEIVALLQGAGVPAGVVQNAADLANDPHLAARRFFVSLDHPALGETVADVSPIRFRGDPPPAWQPAPLLGEANRYVFGDLLGLSDETLASLMEDGVIG